MNCSRQWVTGNISHINNRINTLDKIHKIILNYQIIVAKLEKYLRIKFLISLYKDFVQRRKNND